MKKLVTAQEKYEFAIKVLQRKSREYTDAESCIEEIRDAYGFDDDLPTIVRESFVELEIEYLDKKDALNFVSESLANIIDSEPDFESFAEILYDESVDTDEIPNEDGTYPSDFDDETEC